MYKEILQTECETRRNLDLHQRIKSTENANLWLNIRHIFRTFKISLKDICLEKASICCEVYNIRRTKIWDDNAFFSGEKYPVIRFSKYIGSVIKLFEGRQW